MELAHERVTRDRSFMLALTVTVGLLAGCSSPGVGDAIMSYFSEASRILPHGGNEITGLGRIRPVT
jgi:hypothetical protein